MASASGAGLAMADAVAPVSEKDFLAEMPVVLSVSRLSQRLDETPGAVTVLDRDMIRLSGARDVSDLLRLVPGFQTTMSFERIAPQATYHGTFGSVSNRMQVLVDGRSVYSPFLVGGIGPGLQTVALADIDRIEVLRGSNSAAYGARAFLGVVNIITLDPSQTTGLRAGVTQGENFIADTRASLGVTADQASYRLSIDRRSDNGLQGANDHNTVGRVNFHSSFQINGTDQLELRLGQLSIDAGTGIAGIADNPLRDTAYLSNHLQIDWMRSLSADSDVIFRLSRSEESYTDRFNYSLVPLGLADYTVIDASGKAVMDTVSFQHTFRANQAVRVVWGSEWRSEQVRSRPLYDTEAPIGSEFFRLFGNAEWQMQSALILNAGLMAEKNADGGDSLAPRVMLNWHMAPGHTMRVGESHAYRPASAYEQHCNVRYTSSTGIPVGTTNLCNGKVQSEFVRARELGYLGDFPGINMALDLRLFNEQLSGVIVQSSGSSGIKTFTNADNFAIDGVEYQLKWRPWPGGQVMFNQSFIHNDSSNADTAMSAPAQSNALVFFQKLPGNMDFSLMHQSADERVLSENRSVSLARSISRTDMRIAVPLRLGAARAELAGVIQNIGPAYADYDPKRASFQQRAFVSLSVEM